MATTKKTAAKKTVIETPKQVLFDEIPSWTSDKEKALLRKLAQEVPAGETILEIGCLFGGSTAVMALANPSAKIVSMDNFSWTPEGYPTASKDFMLANLKHQNIKNVTIMEGDSRVLVKQWSQQVALCFIDGGHSDDFVYNDLHGFAPWSKVIALHDYGNPGWAGIKDIVDAAMKNNHAWCLAEVVDTIAVLRRK